MIKLSRKKLHPILIYTGKIEDKIKGARLKVTESELNISDEYEADDYQRI